MNVLVYKGDRIRNKVIRGIVKVAPIMDKWKKLVSDGSVMRREGV